MSTQLIGTPVQVVAQKLYSDSVTALHTLGDLVHSNDGRSFRYCQAGATALVSGKLQQSSAEDTGLQNLTAVANSAGDLVLASSTSVTITANEYAGGLAIVSVTPGAGKVYKVKGHIAYTSAAPTFQLEDAIVTAMTTTSRFDLIRNPFANTIVLPTTATSAPSGVAIHPITAAYYGWLQVGGVASILSDGGATVGTTQVASNGVAGAVEAFAGVQAVVAVAQTGVATGDYGAFRLVGMI